MAIKHTFRGKDGPETKSLTSLKAIREKCLECSNYATSEVRNCPITDCVLYPFRMGKGTSPNRGKKKKNGPDKACSE